MNPIKNPNIKNMITVIIKIQNNPNNIDLVISILVSPF